MNVSSHMVTSPTDSAFKQQRLPAWKTMLTARTALPPFFIIGVASIIVGFDLLYISDKIREHIIDYTYCTQIGTLNTTCFDVIRTNPYANCVCNIDFELQRDFLGKVYMYYGLSNYYQNHRRYVKSRDNDQLLGRLFEKPSNDCCPFKTNPAHKLPIAPCGAIANSFFNDTLRIQKQGTPQFIPLMRTGIAWPSDKKKKFKNPEIGLQEGEFVEILLVMERIIAIFYLKLWKVSRSRLHGERIFGNWIQKIRKITVLR